jgi:hypothetical protein
MIYKGRDIPTLAVDPLAIDAVVEDDNNSMEFMAPCNCFCAPMCHEHQRNSAILPHCGVCGYADTASVNFALILLAMGITTLKIGSSDESRLIISGLDEKGNETTLIHTNFAVTIRRGLVSDLF